MTRSKLPCKTKKTNEKKKNTFPENPHDLHIGQQAKNFFCAGHEFLDSMRSESDMPAHFRIVFYLFQKIAKDRKGYTILRRATICKNTGILSNNLTRELKIAVLKNRIFEVRLRDDCYLYMTNPNFMGFSLTLKKGETLNFLDICKRHINEITDKAWLAKLKDLGIEPKTSDLTTLNEPKSSDLMIQIIKSDDPNNQTGCFSNQEKSPESQDSSGIRDEGLKSHNILLLENPTFISSSSGGKGSGVPLEGDQTIDDFLKAIRERGWGDPSDQLLWKTSLSNLVTHYPEDIALIIQCSKFMAIDKRDLYGRPLKNHPSVLLNPKYWPAMKLQAEIRALKNREKAERDKAKEPVVVPISPDDKVFDPSTIGSILKSLSSENEITAHAKPKEPEPTSLSDEKDEKALREERARARIATKGMSYSDQLAYLKKHHPKLV